MADWREAAQTKADKYLSDRKSRGKTTSIIKFREAVGSRRERAGLNPEPIKPSFDCYIAIHDNFKLFVSKYCKNTNFAEDVLFKMIVAMEYFGAGNSKKAVDYVFDFKTCEGTKRHDIITFDNLNRPINLRLLASQCMKKGKLNYNIKNVPITMKLTRI